MFTSTRPYQNIGNAMAVNSSGEDRARFLKGYNNFPLLEDYHEPTYFINNNIFPKLCLPTTITVSKPS